MKTFRVVMFAVFILVVVAAAGGGDGPTMIVVDPAAGGMVVSVGGRLYTATLTPLAVPAAAGAGAASPALETAARNFMYEIPKYHRRIADEVESSGASGSEADVGRRALELRDVAARGMGEALGEALRSSGGFAGGRVVDRSKVAAVFRRVAAGMDAALRPR
jgi:hypothetical protein